MARRLPAEWEEQDGVLLAWPHERTDWESVLDEVEPVFAEIVRQISLREKVLAVVADEASVRRTLELSGTAMEKIRFYPLCSNDTWARDFGPLVVEENGQMLVLDFGFNGWGLKFPADYDNAITRGLHRKGAFGSIPLEPQGLILEGGSIESDGSGTILTTANCLLSPNRNPHLSRSEIEAELGRLLGADRILWLEHGHLAGDDTDSHVDTLVRLCPDDTIVHVACDDPSDEHYPEICEMVEELRQFKTRNGGSYRLVPLPWPEPKFAPDGHRLPATYANFLVINDAVLVPTYRDKKDTAALSAVGRAYPDRRIVGIDCLPLILQHGSLHCVTMQLYKGVFP